MVCRQGATLDALAGTNSPSSSCRPPRGSHKGKLLAVREAGVGATGRVGPAELIASGKTVPNQSGAVYACGAARNTLV